MPVMDAQPYACDLSKCLMEADANLLGPPLEGQQQFPADAKPPSCVSPTCSAGCCVVLGPMSSQGALMPDCSCARGNRFRGCKRRIWRSSELSTLVLLHSALGNKWSAIAKYLHGRSDNDCKNIFYSALRSKTSQTNRLLRTYAQAVGPNCDDPLARQNAYKAAKQQVAARNATLISRAAALAPRAARQASSRGGSSSDDDSDIPADAAAAAAQAVAALPHADAAAAVAAAEAAAAAAAAADDDAQEDLDAMDATAFASALQLQKAAAAAAVAAAANGGSGDPAPDASPVDPRALIRRLSAQSGNRDASMYGAGGSSSTLSGRASPSLVPSFTHPEAATVGTAAAGTAGTSTQHPPASAPSRPRPQSHLDDSEPHPVGGSRQQALLPEHHQHHHPWLPAHALQPPPLPHPLRQPRHRQVPFGLYPSHLQTATSQDSPQPAAAAAAPSPPVAASLAHGAEAGAALPEASSAHLAPGGSLTESMHDATSPPPAPPSAPLLSRPGQRRYKARERDLGSAAADATAAASAAAAAAAAAGSSSSGTYCAMKGDWSPNGAMIPAVDVSAMHISAATATQQQQMVMATHVPGSSQPAGRSSGGGAPPGAGGPGFQLDGGRTSGHNTPDLPQTHPTSASSQSSGAPPAPTHVHMAYHPPPHTGVPVPMPVPIAPGPGTAALPPSAAAAQAQGPHLPSSTPQPSRHAVSSAPLGMHVPQMTSYEDLAEGSPSQVGGPGGAAVPDWATPPTATGGPPASKYGHLKYDMMPSGMQGPHGMFLYPGGAALDLPVPPLEMPGGGAGAAVGFPPLPPSLVQQQQQQYHLSLHLQAQLQAQQQQLQEQQLQLQAQLAQLQALQHQHHRLQMQHMSAQASASAAQGHGHCPSPLPGAWMPGCSHPSGSAVMRGGGVQPLQPAFGARLSADAPPLPLVAPTDDSLTEMWLSMMD